MGIFGLCGEVGLFRRLKIGESAFGGRISGPSREVRSLLEGSTIGGFTVVNITRAWF
jgi:hypothetical protein